MTAVLALALAVGFVVWLLTRGDDSSSPSLSPTTQPSRRAQPLLRAATPRSIAALSAKMKQPIFWAGRRRGVKYELTRTVDGRVYVRYLPRGVRVGNRSGEYLLIGTYPVRDAYAAVQRATKEAGAQTFSVPGGGLAVVNSSAPKNVYFAFPHGRYQVEVFDPSAQRARRLVASGAVKPVR